MVKKLFIFLVASTFFFSCEMLIPDFSKENPNVILFFVDDLGYGELGVYGQRIIQTRNIDALANNGVLFTQFYSGSPVCAPSRSVLLTGMHSGHTYIRGNHEWGERGDVWSYEKMFEDPNLEGQYPIKQSTITLSKVLSEGGYKTGMVGKWGLGAPNSTSVPTTMGFDYFYGYNCQRIAHNLYPPHLWENENKVLLDNELVSPRTKLDEGAELVIQKHFFKDIRGNLRKFSMQQFRCVKCNAKYRRPPLSGKCTECPAGKLIFTISEGSVVKYLGHSLRLAQEYDFSPYLKQTIDLLQLNVEDVFGRAKDKQVALKNFI